MLSEEELSNQRDDVWQIMYRAYELYEQRDAKYKGLWADAGAQDNAFHLRHKAMRVFRMFESCEWDDQGRPLNLVGYMTEDAFDMMNYTAFYIWCMEHGHYRPEGDQSPLDDIEASIFVAPRNTCPVCFRESAIGYTEYQIATGGLTMRQYNPCHHIIQFQESNRV